MGTKSPQTTCKRWTLAVTLITAYGVGLALIIDSFVPKSEANCGVGIYSSFCGELIHPLLLLAVMVPVAGIGMWLLHSDQTIQRTKSETAGENPVEWGVEELRHIRRRIQSVNERTAWYDDFPEKLEEIIDEIDWVIAHATKEGKS